MAGTHSLARLLVVFGLICVVFCDTPANCTYDDIEGIWTFYEGVTGGDRYLNCSAWTPSEAQSTKTVSLLFPNTAIDQDGLAGNWTLIYNQGYEVVFPNRRYFAFSTYISRVLPNGTTVYTNECNTTFAGWAHDNSGEPMGPANWSCWSGTFLSENPTSNVVKSYAPKTVVVNPPSRQAWPISEAYVNVLNENQNSWQASTYADLHGGLTFAQMMRRGGGRANLGQARAAAVTPAQKALRQTLPQSWDWRSVNGSNYVSPVRNQGDCGSCYSFASCGMMEARTRISSNNLFQLVFSPQDVIACSNYSQGCEGGFIYLIGGKYGMDFCLAEEACNPYKGVDQSTCTTKEPCQRWCTKSYEYVGGFYGACNEVVMMYDLITNGPVGVSFFVTDEFVHYKGGIYQQNYTLSQMARKAALEVDAVNFDPFEITNHAVLLVGYGQENGTLYWTVKNSWGTAWGEEGYFRIVRGIDELAIESIAMSAIPESVPKGGPN